GAELLAERPELPELQPVVADHAGVGRAAARVFVREVVDDLVEFAFEIEGVKRDVQAIGDAAGIAGIDGGTTAFLVVAASVGLVVAVGPRAHEEADDIVTLPLE